MKRIHTLRLPFLGICCLLASCQPPGEGRKAVHGMEKGAEIISALEAFRSTAGRYPRSLQELGGGYEGADLDYDSVGVMYHYSSSAEERFSLSFNYHGPGTNTCSLVPDVSPPDWNCTGAY